MAEAPDQTRRRRVFRPPIDSSPRADFHPIYLTSSIPTAHVLLFLLIQRRHDVPLLHPRKHSNATPVAPSNRGYTDAPRPCGAKRPREAQPRVVSTDGSTESESADRGLGLCSGRSTPVAFVCVLHPPVSYGLTTQNARILDLTDLAYDAASPFERLETWLRTTGKLYSPRSLSVLLCSDNVACVS